MKTAEFLSFLAEHYPPGPFMVTSTLATNGQRIAYRVSGPGGDYVVKLTDPGRPEAVVRADVGTPAYLAACGFPAPRPLPTRNGQLYLGYEDRFVYLYTFLPGRHPTLRTAFYHRLGALLARLHSIPPGPETPESTYRPEAILDSIREALLRAEGFVGEPCNLTPETQRAILPELLEMIDRFPSFEGLPTGIIHSDPYFINLIESPAGELALIDWEDGGISYPLMDVGYVLAHLCSFNTRDRHTWGVPGPDHGMVARPDWSEAFLSAYQAVRPLSAEERRLLPDAIHLAFLAYILTFDTNEIILDHYQRMKMVS